MISAPAKWPVIPTGREAVRVPAFAVTVDLGPLDLDAGLQSVVPDGAVPAVADPSVCRRPSDGQGDHVPVEAVADVAPAKPAFKENPDDFGAVGEVNVRDFALRTVHGVRENGVPLIQELGDLLGVRVADILLQDRVRPVRWLVRLQGLAQHGQIN